MTQYPSMLQPDHGADEPWIAAHNDRLLQQHLAQPGRKKLQLGCGGHVLGGWLNSDRRRTADDIYILDIREPFALPEMSFDYIYCEHLIEHIGLDEGLSMLKECWKILRPGGVVRIATPSLSFLMRLMGADRSDLEEQYLAWASTMFAGDGISEVAVVVNGFVRSWGHQFIYDHRSLRQVLERAGFDGVEQCRILESRHDELRSLEHVGRLPAGFLELESMIYEARRPG